MFDKNGVLKWGTFYGGSSADIPWSITTDPMNNIFISGTGSLDIPIYDPGNSAYVQTSSKNNAFIAKFEAYFQEFSLEIMTLDTPCFNTCNGSAVIDIQGGEPPYSYSWSTLPIQTDSIAIGLCEGLYKVTVTDNNDSTLIDSITILEYPPFSFTTNITPEKCENENGSITLAGISGGNTSGIYNFLWDAQTNNQTTSSATVLSSGNYTVTITANQCDTVATFVVESEPAPIVDLGNDTVVCFNTYLLDAGNPDNSILWSTGDTTSSIVIDSSELFWREVDNGACTSRDSILVNFSSSPIVNITNDTTLIPGNSISISASGGVNYTWSTGEISETIIVNPLESATYSVTTTNADGCSSTASVTITVDQKFIVYLPNIFSPDQDGVNDKLYVRGNGITELLLRVYNRWGQLVFETNDQSIGWDGSFKDKPLNQGVFVYTLEGSFDNGNLFSEKGNITLIR